MQEETNTDLQDSENQKNASTNWDKSTKQGMMRQNNIKKMGEELKYIHKIDHLYNKSNGKLNSESVYLSTRHNRIELERDIQ